MHNFFMSRLLSRTSTKLNHSFFDQALSTQKKIHEDPLITFRDHDGAVVAHSPPTTEVGGSNPEPYVGKMVLTMVRSLQYRLQKLD